MADGDPGRVLQRTVRHHMMYSGVTARTQIYLGDTERALLDRAAAGTGASRSELIRRAIHATYGDASKDDKLTALRVSAGSWRGRTFSGAEYVDAVRGDLAERLRRLGLEE